MLVSDIDSNSCKITNGLKYQEGVSVKKSKYIEIPSIKLDKNDTSYRVAFSGAEEYGASFSNITQNSVDFSTIGLGDFVSLYLDYDGRIAYLEKNLNGQTGILLKVNLCDSFDDEYILRFFNSHGETVNYRIKSKLYNKFDIDNVSLPILAKYKINGEYVYNINFDMDFQEYGSFPCLKNSNRFGNYFYNDNTLMFLYNGIKNDENSSNPEYYYSVTSDYFKINIHTMRTYLRQRKTISLR